MTAECVHGRPVNEDCPRCGLRQTTYHDGRPLPPPMERHDYPETNMRLEDYPKTDDQLDAMLEEVMQTLNPEEQQQLRRDKVVAPVEEGRADDPRSIRRHALSVAVQIAGGMLEDADTSLDHLRTFDSSMVAALRGVRGAVSEYVRRLKELERLADRRGV